MSQIHHIVVQSVLLLVVFSDSVISQQQCAKIQSKSLSKYTLLDSFHCNNEEKDSLSSEKYVAEYLKKYSDVCAVSLCSVPNKVLENNDLPVASNRQSKLFAKYTYYEQMIHYGQVYNIDPLLLFAIATAESNHNPSATSIKGARGLMQVMPATARRFGLKGHADTLYNADTNIRVSCNYLTALRKMFGNNIQLVLAAYNAGEGAVKKYNMNIPPYKETQEYVKKVMAHYAKLRGV